MKAWFAAKTEEKRDLILKELLIPLGRNVAADCPLAHISLTPFRPGTWALDVIGADTNKAWVFELDIPNTVKLEADPSGDGHSYGGEWRVSRHPIPVSRIVGITPIPNVAEWEAGLTD